MIQIKQNQKRKFLILVFLLKKTDYNTKITEIEGKIPSISGLAINDVLTAVENKIPNISSLVKKKQIKIQKLLKSKRNLLIIITIQTGV